MIVKDEPADRLAMLVDYVRPVVDEIAIVDTGSAQNDTELYRTWGVHVAEIDGITSFADARNASLNLVPTVDWILHLDADELPSLAMMQHMQGVKDDASKRPYGWQYFTKNFWAGELGPEEPYHWHCRLFRRKYGKWYKPVHEGVEIKGQPEHVSMSKQWMIHAPKEAYLIHSKPAMHMDRANTLYAQLGDKARP